MIVDLSILKSKDAKWAVHCPTKESAKEFVEEMRKQYPFHTEFWTATIRWEFYREKTTYCPDINGLNGDNRMTYSDLDFFMNPKNGFTVIAFDSLCKQIEDLPEFESSNVEILFSMPV